MYRVVWSQRAVNDLAGIWTQADPALRQAVTRAAHIVDQVLQDDPLDSGESREGQLRVMFAPPLGVQFQVDPDSQMVLVVHIWLILRRKRRA